MFFGLSFIGFCQDGYPEDPVYFELGQGDIEVQGIFDISGGGLLVLTGKKAFINIESSLHERKLHFFNFPQESVKPHRREKKGNHRARRRRM